MSKAKSTTNKSSKKTRRAPTIRMRARAILDDDRYDEDTHNAISRALKTKDPELADLVSRAERGDIILDLIGEHEKHEEAAALVVKLINESKAPDWLTTAMLVAISDALKVKKVPIYKTAKNGSEDFDVKELANLFVLTQRLDLEPRVAPTARLRVANALSELLCNEETPAELFNRCAEFYNDSVSGAYRGDEVHKAIYWQPDILHRLIEHNEAHDYSEAPEQEASNVSN